MSERSRMSNFRKELSRHGWPQATLAAGLGLIRRLINFELSVLCMNSGKPYEFLGHSVISVETIDCAERFHKALHGEIPAVDYQWSFERGDQCVANVIDNVIVGYGFSTDLPTPVVDDIEFFFPRWCVYSFASYTAPSFRGQRLAKYRWPESHRQKEIRYGTSPREVYYISLANSESLKSDLADGTPSIRLGYAVWLRLGRHTLCWNSPGAKRNGLGFRKSLP